MKKVIFLLFCFAFSSVFAQKIPTVQNFRQREADYKNQLAKNIIAWNLAETENQKSFDVKYYDLRFDLNPGQALLRAEMRMRAKIMDTELAAIELNLINQMNVDSVFVYGSKITFSHKNNMLVIELGRTFVQGDSVETRVFYHGKPNDNGYRAFKFSSRSGKPMIWSLSEPYGARTWWPCKDIPADKADSVDIHVTVPADLIVASNGILRGVSENDGRKTWWWHEKHPIVTYLVSIAAHPYDVHYDDYLYNAGADTMKIHFYTFAGQWDPLQNINLKVKDMIGTFAKLFGEYPFVDEKYGQADFLGGGAMEHQTCTSFGFWGEWVYAHELAHQWWGDMVTCENFHHIWLNEGFATYCEALWKENAYGKSALHDDMAAKAYLGRGTVYVEDLQNDNIFDGNLSYDKGSWVLHTLRHIIGDSTFFHFLHVYYENFKYKTATTEQFRDLCEQVSGKNLHTFFKQWIYESGHPDFQYMYDFQKLDSGGYKVSGIISQVQNDGPIFDLPVDVSIKLVRAETTLVVPVNEREEYFECIVDKRPLRVELDKDDWILKTVKKITKPNIQFYSQSFSDSLGNNDGVWDPGEEISLVVTLENGGAPASDVVAELELTTGDADVSILSSKSSIGHISFKTRVDNLDSPFRLRALPDAHHHVVELTLRVKSANTILADTKIHLNLGTPSLLLVDDDNGADYEIYYQKMASAAGFIAQTWDVAEKGLMSLDELQNFQAIVWFTGDDKSTALTGAEQKLISDYLAADGKLLLSGQYIAKDLADGDANDSLFLADVLNARYVLDLNYNTFILGIADDPIGDDMIALFNDNYPSARNQHGQSGIEPLGDAVTCFEYANANAAAGIHFVNESSGEKVVYFSFGLEGIGGPDANTGQIILSRAMNWLIGPTPVFTNNPLNLPKEFYLEQNFPNPFNPGPGTKIRFSIPTATRVNLTIYNSLGQIVQVIQNGMVNPGRHVATWNGRNEAGERVASGVYFVILKSRDELGSDVVLLKKMVKLQ
ncbi:MAG: T9SS type A sorting domain-containing protein [Calditrichaeota bacterium]|nr:T9SS type A sorting domain-containing protein [Calditrichota bacterium]